MKKIENNFTVSGFVGKDAEIRQFATKFYECPDKEETPAEEPAKPATKKGKK